MLRFMLALASAALAAAAAHAQRPPLEAYAALPDVADAAISPDGRRIAMLRPIDGRNAIAVYDVANLTQPERIGRVGE